MAGKIVILSSGVSYLVRLEGKCRIRILVGEALGPDKLIHTVIRSWRIDIVLDENSLAIPCLDQCRSLVTIGECIHAHLLPCNLKSNDRLRIH